MASKVCLHFNCCAVLFCLTLVSTGHEADHVLISTVRTTQPGFFQLRNHVNVMLTRARVGMVIVACRALFEENARAKGTILGRLVTFWKELRDREQQDGDTRLWTSVRMGSEGE